MKWARSYPCPTRPAKHRRNISAPAIATLRRVVRQQIETARDEIDELKLSDRFHAHQARAACGTDDRGFRDRGINHARFAEVIDQTVSDFEGAAVRANVFADDEDGRVHFHLFPDALANRFDHRGHSATGWPFEFVFFFDGGRHLVQAAAPQVSSPESLVERPVRQSNYQTRHKLRLLLPASASFRPTRNPRRFRVSRPRLSLPAVLSSPRYVLAEISQTDRSDRCASPTIRSRRRERSAGRRAQHDPCDGKSSPLSGQRRVPNAHNR